MTYYFWLGIEAEEIEAERDDRKAVNDWVQSLFADDLN